MDDYSYGTVVYVYFKKEGGENDVEKILQKKLRKRVKIKTDIEIGISFESYTIQNQFLANIINVKSDIIIGGFPQ